jgi:DHA3 family tetracycline resistance protein-like MFS transporter
LLPSANALTMLSRQLAMVAGPALGAFIVSLGGTAIAFATDAGSFLLSAACLLPLRTWSLSVRSAKTSSPFSGIVRDLREGLAIVLDSPWLWLTIAIASLGNITYSGPLSVAMPFLVREHLDANVGVLGLVYSITSIGSIGGALYLGRRRRIRRRGLLAYGAWAAGGSMVLMMGLPITIAGVLCAALVNGATMAAFGLVWTVSLQETVRRDALGRVASIDQLGSFALLPVGYAVTGWATDQLGAPTVFVLGGGLTAALTILGLAHPRIRGFD